MGIKSVMKDAVVMKNNGKAYSIVAFLLNGKEVQFKSDHRKISEFSNQDHFNELKNRIKKLTGKIERHPYYGH